MSRVRWAWTQCGLSVNNAAHSSRSVRTLLHRIAHNERCSMTRAQHLELLTADLRHAHNAVHRMMHTALRYTANDTTSPEWRRMRPSRPSQSLQQHQSVSRPAVETKRRRMRDATATTSNSAVMSYKGACCMYTYTV